MCNSGIYIIRNKVNNKVYVGQSKNLETREKQHFGDLKANKHFNSILQYSWNKHGENSFEFEVIEYCKIEELNDREIYWANKHNAHDRNSGYNIASCGNQGSVFLNKTEDEMRLIREKMSMSRMGYRIKEDTKIKMSEIRKSNIKNRKESIKPKEYIKICKSELVKINQFESSDYEKIMAFIFLVHYKIYGNKNLIEINYNVFYKNCGFKNPKKISNFLNKMMEQNMIKRISKCGSPISVYEVKFNNKKNQKVVYEIKTSQIIDDYLKIMRDNERITWDEFFNRCGLIVQ